MQSIQQTQFLAQNYPVLQGLRAVPAGLCLLLITLWANVQTGPARDLTLPLSLSLACLALYLLVDLFYNRVYGKIKRTISHAEWFWSAICAVLALVAFIIDTTTLTDISMLGLAFALVFAFSAFWYWRSARIIFVVSLVLAGALGSLSLLPAFGLPDWWTLLGLKHALLAFTFLFGLLNVVGGVATHIYFIRSLPVVREAQ